MKCAALALFASVCFLSVVANCSAATLEGKVIKVLDGDTVIVADSTNGEHEVRLNGLDAPEDGKPFFDESKKALAVIVTDQDVMVKWDKQDRRGRILGDLYVGPVCANFQMVVDGWARHYTKYSKDVQLAGAEMAARQAHFGIWKDVEAPPEIPAAITTNIQLEVFTPAK